MIKVHRYGDPSGAPLMALHGIRGHGRRWRRIAEHCLPDRQTLAPDLRGHGHSTWAAPWTIERHVADLLEILGDQTGPADLVGHSFGGLIAVHLARTAPERVRRLVLLDPSIGLEPGKMREQAHNALAPPSFADPAEARADRVASWPAATAQAVDDEVADHLRRTPNGRWGWRFEPAAMVTAFSEMARPLAVPPPGLPTLLVVAERGRVVRPEFVDACRDTLGTDFTVTTLDSGHMLYLDRFHEVGDLLRGNNT